MSRAARVGAVACMVGLLLVCVAAAAQAATPALGRWSGTSAGGRVQFVVSRVGGTLVASDLVVSCAHGAGVDADAHGQDVTTKGLRIAHPESAVARDGAISDGVDDLQPGLHNSTGLHGRLRGATGTVSSTADAIKWLGSGTCPASAFRGVHVHRTGGTELRDGHYTMTGLPPTSGDFWVYGDGALIDYDADFSTPIGGGEDNPEDCAESALYADVGSDSAPYTPILPGPGASFTVQATQTDEVGTLSTISLNGVFHGTHAVGTYSASSDWLDEFACTGTGAFALTPQLLAVPLIADAVARGVATLPGKHRGAPTHRPNPAPGRHRKEKRITYVALGDSYASGDGVTPYVRRGDRCHRSTRAYSRLLHVSGIRFERRFYACSGAGTVNLLSKRKYGEPPQLDHASLRDAGLITVQIGGNDARFGDAIAQCARHVPPACYRGPVAKRALARIRGLEPTLLRSYRAIRSRAHRGATIAVLDYPLIFPQNKADYCAKLTALFPVRAVQFMYDAGNLLDDVIRSAASKAGVRFVDVRSAFAGHEVCSRPEWINFLTRGRFIYGEGSFHPNLAGQQAYARLLKRALTHTL